MVNWLLTTLVFAMECWFYYSLFRQGCNATKTKSNSLRRSSLCCSSISKRSRHIGWHRNAGCVHDDAERDFCIISFAVSLPHAHTVYVRFCSIAFYWVYSQTRLINVRLMSISKAIETWILHGVQVRRKWDKFCCVNGLACAEAGTYLSRCVILPLFTPEAGLSYVISLRPLLTQITHRQFIPR